MELFFFRWNISVICLVVAIKLVVTVFTGLYFRRLWPNCLNFMESFKKHIGLWTKKKPGNWNGETLRLTAVRINRKCQYRKQDLFPEPLLKKSQPRPTLRLRLVSSQFIASFLNSAHLSLRRFTVVFLPAPLGHRNKILRAIKKLQEHDDDKSPPAADISLQSLVQALPPSLQQFAPTVIHHFTKNADSQSKDCPPRRRVNCLNRISSLNASIFSLQMCVARSDTSFHGLPLPSCQDSSKRYKKNLSWLIYWPHIDNRCFPRRCDFFCRPHKPFYSIVVSEAGFKSKQSPRRTRYCIAVQVSLLLITALMIVAGFTVEAR